MILIFRFINFLYFNIYNIYNKYYIYKKYYLDKNFTYKCFLVTIILKYFSMNFYNK